MNQKKLPAFDIRLFFYCRKRRQIIRSLCIEGMKVLSFDCGIKNLALVVLDIVDGKVEIPFFSMIDLTVDEIPGKKESCYMTPRSKRKVRSLTQTLMMNRLIKILNAFKGMDLFVGVESVLIERQMSRCRNVRRIETGLFFYFRLHFPEIHVEIVDPRLKLRRELMETKKKLTYQGRKKMSLAKAKKIVGKEQQISDYLNFDLADAICQATEWERRRRNELKV